MYSLDIAYSMLITMVVALGLIFIFLLAYTFWTRQKKQYWIRYKEKFRDYFLPLLLTFIEEGETKEDADDLIFKLTKRTQDIAFFLEMLDEISDILRGEERDKLNLLIEHELFYNFYKQKLFSFNKRKKLLGCIYFKNLNTIDSPIVERLTSISKSKNVELAYAATKALQSSDDLEFKKKVLHRFLKRDDTSELMVAELLHLFHSDDLEEHRLVGKALTKLLQEEAISSGKKKIIALYFAQKNFYEYADFLLQFLKDIDYSPSKAPLVIGLIQALGQLQIEEAAPIIRKYLQVEHVDIRLTCVKALSNFGGKENLTYLTKRLLYIEFAVRKAIIRSLSENPEIGYQLLYRFLTDNLKFVIRSKKHQNLQSELSEILQKIRNIASGIKIMLPKKKRAA